MIIRKPCGCIVDVDFLHNDNNITLAFCEKHSFLNIGRHPKFQLPIIRYEKKTKKANKKQIDKVLNEIKKAKKRDVIYWNEATGEIKNITQS